MADHRHEIYDIYGTAATSGDVESLKSNIGGLRVDLADLRDQLADLGKRVSTLQAVLSAHLAEASQPVSSQAVTRG